MKTPPRLHFLALCALPVLGCSKNPDATGPAPQATSAADRAYTASTTATAKTAAASEKTDQRPALPRAPLQAPDGMILIPGGSFEMGMPPELTGGNPRVHTTVKPFFLDRLEVTTEAYLTCVEVGRCEPTAKKSGCNATARKPRLRHPINCLSKVQAEHYCTEQGKRLPTEAEWEYAARGTDGRTYPWGNELPQEQLCWERRKDAEDQSTCPVGSFPQGASPFGALDMAGNVWEWTSTEETDAVVRPPEGKGSFRIRGGSFKVNELSGPDDYEVRSDQSSVYPHEGASTEIGVRCAKDI